MNRIFLFRVPRVPSVKKYSELETENSEQLRTRFSRKTFHKKLRTTENTHPTKNFSQKTEN